MRSQSLALALFALAGCGGTAAAPREATALAEVASSLRADLPSSAAASSVESDAPSSAETTDEPAADSDDAAAPQDPADSTVRPDLGGGYVVTGTTPHRLLLFTFDDGPHPVYTREMLDALDRADIRAVFFVVARRLGARSGRFAAVADVLRETAARGHFIGSHTRDHEILTRLSAEDLETQVVGAEDLIRDAIGARPWLLRPPGGAHDAELDAYLAGRGYSEVLWSIATEDWLTRDPDVVVANFVRVMRGRERRGTPGGVIVLHDTHPWTVAAFPRIVDWIDERNCELLARGEEVYDIVDDPSLFVVRRPPGMSPSERSPPIVLAADVLAARQRSAVVRATERCAGR